MASKSRETGSARHRSEKKRGYLPAPSQSQGRYDAFGVLPQNSGTVISRVTLDKRIAPKLEANDREEIVL